MKTSDKTLTRLCLRLYTKDVEAINDLCHATNQEFNTVVRNMVATFVRQMKARENRALDQVEKQQPAPMTHLGTI